MDRKSVCIIGGGLAGLSAAVFLSQYKQFEITLFESAPRLGGRAYSFLDKTLNRYVDNGQHIFAGWYKDSFDFLKLIGSYDKLNFQKTLEVKFVEPGGRKISVSSGGSSISGPFTFMDKLAVLNFITSIKLNRFSIEDLKHITISELFKRTKQSSNLIKYFWNPLVIAVFNTTPEKASAGLFVNVVKEALSIADGFTLVLPEVNLNGLYIDPALKYLSNNQVEVNTSANLKHLNFSDDKVESVVFENGEERIYDYYISAVSFYDFKSIVSEEIFDKDFKFISKIEASPIINIHYWFDSSAGSIHGLNDFIKEDFLGVAGTNIQWIFKQSDDHLCLVISGADKLVDMKNEEIMEISKRELYDCLPAISKLNITYSKVIKEKRATFLPSPESSYSRPKDITKFTNLFIAGDWTDTGLPALIEGAVRSGRRCAEKITEIV